MRALRDGISDVRRYQMRHRLARKCTHCPRTASSGKTKCADCLGKMRQRYQERKVLARGGSL